MGFEGQDGIPSANELNNFKQLREKQEREMTPEQAFLKLRAEVGAEKQEWDSMRDALFSRYESGDTDSLLNYVNNMNNNAIREKAIEEIALQFNLLVPDVVSLLEKAAQ